MEEVRHRRIALKMSQSSLALAVGSTQAIMSKWELGKKIPGRVSKGKLVKWLGFDPGLKTPL